MSFYDYSDSVEYPIFLDECTSSEQLKKFRKTIDKHHQYMNSANIPSRRMSYNVYETKSGNYIGGIGLPSSVLALGGRDKYIGWDKEARLKNLGKTANNYRFCLIKENITMKNVGTMALKLLRKVGAKRWKEKYGDDLILLETFVQPKIDGSNNKRNGAVYLADNWSMIGKTQGNSIKKAPLLLWQKEDSKRGKLARENPKEAIKKYAVGREHYVVAKSPINEGAALE